MATTAERLRIALNIRGMKQSDLAEVTKIGKSSISTYLSGDYLPKQKNIHLMAEALNVNEAWLRGEDAPMEHDDAFIKQRREYLGYTLAQIAEKMNVPEETVKLWESGNIKSMRYVEFRKLAEILQVDPFSLFDWDTATAVLSDDINQKLSDYGEHYYSLMDAFQELNGDGQQKAVERVTELAEIPRYRK